MMGHRDSRVGRMNLAIMVGIALGLLTGGGLWGARPAAGCSIPVFRYALERWPADPYQVLVFHRGPLGAAEQTALEVLGGGSENASPANLQVQWIDLADEDDPQAQQLAEAFSPEELPWVVVQYPREAQLQATVWSGPLDRQSVEKLVDSPLRREIARRILQGESAVWVLLESGDAERDDAAAERLEAELEKMQATLKLPELPAPELPDLPTLDNGSPDAHDETIATAVELRLAFSVVRLARDDPHEQALVAMLLESEEDLKDFPDQPMALPVFGRGRALYALVGKGIHESTIAEACEFLIGDCSCQIKQLNPGTDLLMTVAWDSLIEGRVALDKELPPLVGLSGFAEPAREDQADASQQAAPAAASATGSLAQASAPQTKSSSLNRNLLLVMLLGVMVVVGATVAMALRRG